MKAPSRSKSKNRVVTFKITYYDGPTTRKIEKFVRGISVDITEHEVRSAFYILDEMGQEAFIIPYRQLVECIQVGVEKQPRKKKHKGVLVAHSKNSLQAIK